MFPNLDVSSVVNQLPIEANRYKHSNFTFGKETSKIEYIGIPSFIGLRFITFHRCCVFPQIEGKPLPPTSKKISLLYSDALLYRSGLEPNLQRCSSVRRPSERLGL